jgi:hypothetical protein
MSLRLEILEPLAGQLQRYCQVHEQPADEVVRQALRDFLDREHSTPTPYELWRQAFTPEGSGQPDLGQRAKEHLWEKLCGRHSD